MEKTEVTIDDPIVLDGLTIIPVVSLSLNGWHLDHFTTVCGVKNLVAFLLISPAERKAYRASGEELSTDQLIEELPDLKEILERFESALRHL
ncbi:MAG: hypothetical protein OEU26_13800 [Candidatus Tectomicrobia bacterium]|nr:hypothetical protein [Candidatus Tectomicrobia bacterium]